ncbi:hypothetical protein WG922_02185 [Ramlibacter sp. AN1015]|uniref:hypothetical protein n=1 Tax=Ramlibacter sp. AN1015 TaxID=3133428 RepID=UPI0030C0B0D6
MSGALPWRRTLATCLAALALAGCGTGGPPPPPWRGEAAAALERYQQAVLTGAERVAQADFRRARDALAATGDATLVARAELTRCAMQVAVLDFRDCAGFESLRGDVAPPEHAYAAYLSGLPLSAAQVGLLPVQHRPVAEPARAATPDAAALRAIEDPVARLVAAGVLLRGGRAAPAVAELAADTASAQGWRRPLLAWLGVQLRLAERSGDGERVQQLQRRMALVAGEEAARDGQGARP